MNRPDARHAACAALLAVVSACAGSGAQSSTRLVRPSLVTEARDASPYPSPGRFRYHPRELARVRAAPVLPDGRRLLVGERGERWLFEPAGRRLVAGTALAPEALVAVLRDAERGFWFVGESGASYGANEPLGPFLRAYAPPEALREVSAADHYVLGVQTERGLSRSADYGASWAEVGPREAAIVDVALSPSGHGLALGVPETLFATADFGASWQPVPTPAAFGTVGVSTDADGALHLLTVLGERRWDALAGAPAAAPRNERALGDLPELPRGPDAGALAEGRAVLDGMRYLELAPGSTPGSFELYSGPLDRALSAVPVPAAAGCRHVRFAAFGRWLGFACFRTSAESSPQAIELFFGNDAGHFVKAEGRLLGAVARFRLALGADGRWVAGGLCQTDAPGPDCQPNGLIYGKVGQSPAKAGTERSSGPGRVASTPLLAGPVLALAFSIDGRRAYAVGRQKKAGTLALFLARDGGASFEAHDLDPSDGGDSSSARLARFRDVEVESLGAAEDGNVAVTLAHRGARTLIVADEHGRLLSTASAPEKGALLGAAGLRAVAVVPASRQLWESLDGGVTWLPSARLPFDLCPGDRQCEVPVRCARHACAIGHELTRIGWGGRADEQASLLPPPVAASTRAAQRTRTPIACTLAAGAWRPLPGVASLPDASAAALGAADWFAVAEDAERAGATLYKAIHGRVEPSVLLPPVARPSDYALAVSEQVEGVAALRYRIPESVPGESRLLDLEVAWDDVLHGRAVRAAVPDAGGFAPGDYERSAEGAQRAKPDLLSIANGGLYLRAHGSKQPDQPTLFLDGRRVTSLPAPAWPDLFWLPSRTEFVRLGRADVPIKLVGRGAAVVRATRTGAAWSVEAFATGMAAPMEFDLEQGASITYVGDVAALHVETLGADGRAEGALFPFRADGPVVAPKIAAPTQAALGDRPDACRADRPVGTRVVAGFGRDTRHAVLVTDSIDAPRVLLTGSAVLYGTPTSICAAAFEAVPVTTSEAERAPREAALVLLGSPERSVLFRYASSDARDVSYRSMSCRFDPALEIPPEVYRALETQR